MAAKATSQVKQPESFTFSDENEKRISEIIANYPPGRQQSAVIPLLDIAQRQNDNWLPRAAMDEVARILDMPPIRVYEVATFYTMFNLEPVGKHFVQVCTTTPCMLCGSDEIVKTCKKKTGIKNFGETSKDGKFTLVEVECLGACVNAPMVQINDDYYEDLTPELMEELLDKLAKGEEVDIGSQIGRQGSMAVSGPTSLLELADDKKAANDGKKAAKKPAKKKTTAKKTTAKKKTAAKKSSGKKGKKE